MMNGADGADTIVQAVTARLPSGVVVKVEAAADSADGMTSVGLRDYDLGSALDSVGEISSLVVEKLKAARPSRTTVELKLGFAVEAGKLTALWVGGKGEASLTVTMEWSRSADSEGTSSADRGGSDRTQRIPGTLRTPGTRMAERLENLLRECTVQVIGERTTGAGFFIAPGKVMTCVHVIGDSPGLRVRWERDGQDAVEFQVIGAPVRLATRGKAIAALEVEYPDIAVLDVVGTDGHPCVRMDAEWPEDGDSFQVYGYPKEGGTIRLTPARLGYRGKHGNEPLAYLDLASDTVKPGMSGAAVLNRRTGGVCGVVVASKNAAQPDGALAVPWQAIAAELSDLLTANWAFHTQDARWRAAAAPLNAAVPGTAVPGTVLPGTVLPGTASRRAGRSSSIRRSTRRSPGSPMRPIPVRSCSPAAIPSRVPTGC